ncbi:MAG TPA: FMN-binding protein [Gemmatimonadetes bacterium]|nr:FMN-binding protein [Gemmatimonadota bacterium]
MSSRALLFSLLLSACAAPCAQAAAGATPELKPIDPMTPTASGAKVYLTTDQALALAFPDCKFERSTVALSKAEQQRVAKLSSDDFKKGLVFPYIAKKDGKVVGTAYFDTHKVRTHRETLMVAVDAKARIKRVEVLSFAEPQEYVPRSKWYAQFDGKGLSKKLKLKKDIKTVTGATLTARATTGAARRVLAIHQVIGERKPAPKPLPKAAPQQ